MNQLDPKPSAPSHVQLHFSAYQRSGLSIKAYCEKHSVSLSTFHYWRKRYRMRPASLPGDKARPTFMDIGTFGVSDRACEVHFPGGVKVTVHAGSSPDQVVSILRVISELNKC